MDDLYAAAMADDDGQLKRELAALATWAEFPAGRSPRPLVLTGHDWARVPSTGFPDVEHKEAHSAGAVIARCEIPSAVLGALRGQVRPFQGDPLVVSSATRADAEFESDRGPVLLPSWDIVIDEVSGAFVVLDPDVADRAWSARGSNDTGFGGYDCAVGDLGGTTFVLSFIGSPEIYTDYHPPLRLHTSPGAIVAGLPVPAERSLVGARHTHAQRREITVELPGPLGDRVLVNSFGEPVPVLAEGAPRRGDSTQGR